MGITVETVELTADALRIELREFEARYGVPSARRHEPFTTETGELRETEDWRVWDSLYAIWRRTFAPMQIS